MNPAIEAAWDAINAACRRIEPTEHLCAGTTPATRRVYVDHASTDIRQTFKRFQKAPAELLPVANVKPIRRNMK